AVKVAVKAAVKAARGGTVSSSSFLVLAGYGFVGKKRQPIKLAVFLYPNLIHWAFTREFGLGCHPIKCCVRLFAGPFS
ncbi:hypothetical protein IOC57_22350, partial [Bacillus sp. SD075]|uniref:hypothetical protein n=1 Tax=Bacillus sp. SD075 TaxID=2781732 RepID=UPI001A97D339